MIMAILLQILYNHILRIYENIRYINWQYKTQYRVSMNNKTQLVITENQELNRVVKGQEIYNNGLVDARDGNIFVVKEQYIVEDISTNDIDPLFTCTCKDFEYREIDRCKHIIAVEFYLLDKVNGA